MRVILVFLARLVSAFVEYMGHLQSRQSGKTNQTNSDVRRCLAHVSDACRLRGGLLEPARAQTARYCADCAPLVRRARSAAWKCTKRHELGWRGYRDAYSPYVDQEAGRKYQREYKQRRRAQARPTKLNPV